MTTELRAYISRIGCTTTEVDTQELGVALNLVADAIDRQSTPGSIEQGLIEAYHVCFDVKDAHQPTLDDVDEKIRYAAYLACQRVEQLMNLLGYSAPRRFDGQGRP